MTADALSGHYDAVRDALAEQYRLPMNPATGLAPEELLAKAQQYLVTTGATKPRIIQRAEMLHMLLSDAAIRINQTTGSQTILTPVASCGKSSSNG